MTQNRRPKWAKVTVDGFQYVRRNRKELSVAAKDLLFGLGELTDYEGRVWRTQAELAAHMEMDAGQVSKSLRELTRHGIITVVKGKFIQFCPWFLSVGRTFQVVEDAQG